MIQKTINPKLQETNKPQNTATGVILYFNYVLRLISETYYFNTRQKDMLAAIHNTSITRARRAHTLCTAACHDYGHIYPVALCMSVHIITVLVRTKMKMNAKMDQAKMKSNQES